MAPRPDPAKVRTGETGRPLALLNTAYLDRNGQPVTVEDAIIQRVTVGQPLHRAARSVGISGDVLRDWTRIAGLARARQALTDTGHKPPPKPLTKNEQRLVAFLLRLEAAEAEAELRKVMIVEGLATGGQRVLRTIEKRDAHGNLVERTETVETTLPSFAAARWWLEQRVPETWGRNRVEVTGADGAPLVDGEGATAGLVAAIRAGMSADVTEDTSASEGDDEG